MASPKQPEFVRPLVSHPRSLSPPENDGHVPTPSGRIKRIPPPDSQPGKLSTPASPAPAQTPELGMKVMPYLRTALPAGFDFSLFTLCKEGPPLLQLPIQRYITDNWIKRVTTLKVRSPWCVIALLLFLTGTPAKNSCIKCVGCEPGKECIVPGPSFPSFAVERFGGSCASCFYKSNRWHQRNNCTLVPANSDAEVQRAVSQALSSEDYDAIIPPWSESEVGDEKDDDEQDGGSHVEKPMLANGTSVPHTPAEVSVLRPPIPEPHVIPPTHGGRDSTTPSALLNQGNLMSADILEMEDWEIAPGTIRSTSDEPDSKFAQLLHTCLSQQ